MIITIYAQEDLSNIKDNDVVFFLAGPTQKNYLWRQQLVEYITEKFIDSEHTFDIYFLIPESRIYYGCSTGFGNMVESLKPQNLEFYENAEKHDMSFDCINQIQWETDAMNKGYIIYNMCQHWKNMPIIGRHGNISPTGRMEVHPQSSDSKKWIYYNNLNGDFSLNTECNVCLGGEAPGDNVGWLVWWILKKNLTYTTNVQMLVNCISAIVNKTDV